MIKYSSKSDLKGKLKEYYDKLKVCKEGGVPYRGMVPSVGGAYLTLIFYYCRRHSVGGAYLTLNYYYYCRRHRKWWILFCVMVMICLQWSA